MRPVTFLRAGATHLASVEGPRAQEESPTRIYLADLGHNLLTLSSDTYPLGVGNLASYLSAYLPARVDGPVALELRLFREPQDLKAALDAAPPDLLALSNYAWNEELAHHFAGYAKRRRPDTLTCMGGPNWPLTRDVQESFLRSLRHVDVYVEGPTYEGERALLELVARFHAAGGRAAGVFEEPLPGSVWIDPTSGDFVHGGEVPRIRDLDEIPSPYLGGWLDPWFETGYFPLLQIARGCPFSCSFCNSGVRQNSKINAHSVENVKADLLYIAERVKPGTTLCFADDNFGMYQRDEEIADYIGWLQEHHGWPRYIRTTTGKNNGERIIRVMRKVRGTLPMTAAVQSLNPTALANIRRSNIKLETYALLQQELRDQGMQSYGELILCLPGESRESFMASVEKLLDAGCKRISAHQLMLLHGAELANPESREKFGFDTRFRVVARNIGDYTGEPVVEVEEMVVATPVLDFDEYLETRVFHLLLTIFFYEGNFEEAFELARLAGVKPYDLVARMPALLDRVPAFQRVIDEFLRESQEELFPTRQECLDWARENYVGLVSGELGGNLLSRYSMIGRFYATGAALDFLGIAIEEAVAAGGGSLEADELAAVIRHLRAVLLGAPFAEALDADVRFSSAYDLESWAGDGYKRPLAEYRVEPRALRASVPPDRRALILRKVETFGEHPAGLGKFTRSLFARDLRRDVEPVG